MKIFIMSLFIMLSVLPQVARPIVPEFVFDPRNHFQNLKRVKNSVDQLKNQAEQIEYQIESLNYQIQNTRSINNFQWREITNLLSQATEITRQGQSISYAMADLDKQFNQRYPNYVKNNATVNYQSAYQQWNQSTLQTLQSSLKSIGLVANDLEREDIVVDHLKQQSKTTTGQLQALQVTHQINTETIHQLQSLKQIVAAQSNAQTAYMAQQVSEASYEEQAVSSLIDKMPTEFPIYQENKAYGRLPESSE